MSGNIFVLKFPLDEDKYRTQDKENIEKIKFHHEEIENNIKKYRLDLLSKKINREEFLEIKTFYSAKIRKFYYSKV